MDMNNTETIVNRLMENQEDIGNTLSPITGNLVAEEIISLLKEHITIASEIVKYKLLAYNVNNEAYITMVKDKITAALDNSTKFSLLISTVNENTEYYSLPYEEVKKHFDEHNKYVVSLADIYINQDDNLAIKEYDCYYNHMLHFSDMLSLLFKQK
jgi:siroheme synthase (precorrin-2 oxidase/ferrochelatase)